MHQEDAHLTNVKFTSLFWKGYLNKASISVCGQQIIPGDYGLINN